MQILASYLSCMDDVKPKLCKITDDITLAIANGKRFSFRAFRAC